MKRRTAQREIDKIRWGEQLYKIGVLIEKSVKKNFDLEIIANGMMQRDTAAGIFSKITLNR